MQFCHQVLVARARRRWLPVRPALLLNRKLRRHDRRRGTVDMIVVTQEAILSCHPAGVTGLTEFLFHDAEI